MRFFIVLLAAANILFFLWTRGTFNSSSTSSSAHLQQELLAHHLNIVSHDTPPPEVLSTKPQADAPHPSEPSSSLHAAPLTTSSPGPNAHTSKKTTEKPPVLPEPNPTPKKVCLRISDLSIPLAARLRKALTKNYPKHRIKHSLIHTRKAYWVHLPPAPSLSSATEKTGSLKKKGIRDFFIMREKGPNYLAISLGVFSTKAAAQAHIRTLESHGIHQLKLSERHIKTSLASLDITGTTTDSDALRQFLVKYAPNARFSECKK